MRKTAPEPMAIIDRAEFSAPEKLDEIREWNRQQKLPTRNGFSHELENFAHITFDPDISYLESGTKSVQADQYGQSIETVEGDEHVGPFGAELADGEGNRWTPSVAGPELTLVILIPGGSANADFTITRVAELFKLDLSGDHDSWPDTRV